MKKIPIGIQNIQEVLTEDYLYVDKTHFAQELIQTGKHYFLSRPRRFGKSLFLSTLEEILKGNKELFKDCHIYQADYEWQQYPVLSIDFSRIANRTPVELEGSLKRTLQRLAKAHQLSITTPTLQEGLEALVVALYQQKESKVVFLVDEYDKPIIDHLESVESAQGNRLLLRDFFGTLKSLDKYLKLTFITGISRFSKVSLFSEANHLDDISMYPQYATLMGYTAEELKATFAEHIQTIAQKRGVDQGAILAEIKEWYNGYRFTKASKYVYNPFSTLKYISTREANSYWYTTGTPAFLIKEIQKRPNLTTTLSGISVSKSALMDIRSVENVDLASLMFQTGYLTIKRYYEKEKAYQLDFPNEEVRSAFFDSLLNELTVMDTLTVTRAAEQLRKHLSLLELGAFVQTINSHFAKMPYHVFVHAKEGFYQAVFLTLLEKSDIPVQAEVLTNQGRIDVIAQLPDKTFIFELKVDQTAAHAFEQAEDKYYSERYLREGKEVVVLGMNFGTQTRNIADWKGGLYKANGTLVKELGGNE